MILFIFMPPMMFCSVYVLFTYNYRVHYTVAYHIPNYPSILPIRLAILFSQSLIHLPVRRLSTVFSFPPTVTGWSVRPAPPRIAESSLESWEHDEEGRQK